jgi:hypothetical protein
LILQFLLIGPRVQNQLQVAWTTKDFYNGHGGLMSTESSSDKETMISDGIEKSNRINDLPLEKPKVHPAFLDVPEDDYQLMMTPPIPYEPLPLGWHLTREESPVLEQLSPFDLDAPEGMVSLGDGTYAKVEDTKELVPCDLDKDDPKYQVTRRRILKSSKESVPPLVIDFYDNK